MRNPHTGDKVRVEHGSRSTARTKQQNHVALEGMSVRVLRQKAAAAGVGAAELEAAEGEKAAVAKKILAAAILAKHGRSQKRTIRNNTRSTERHGDQKSQSSKSYTIHIRILPFTT